MKKGYVILAGYPANETGYPTGYQKRPDIRCNPRKIVEPQYSDFATDLDDGEVGLKVEVGHVPEGNTLRPHVEHLQQQPSSKKATH